MQYDQCLTRGADNSAVIITHCDQKQHNEWKYFKVRCTNSCLENIWHFSNCVFFFLSLSFLLQDLHRFTHVTTGNFYISSAFLMFWNHIVTMWWVWMTMICDPYTGKCLDRSDLLHTVFVSDCDPSKTTQKWEMNNIVAVWGKHFEYITPPYYKFTELWSWWCSQRAGQQLWEAGPCAPRV